MSSVTESFRRALPPVFFAVVANFPVVSAVTVFSALACLSAVRRVVLTVTLPLTCFPEAPPVSVVRLSRRFGLLAHEPSSASTDSHDRPNETALPVCFHFSGSSSLAGCLVDNDAAVVRYSNAWWRMNVALGLLCRRRLVRGTLVGALLS